MTPEDKAAEMINKYLGMPWSQFSSSLLCSKQCALIAVDEIIKQVHRFDTDSINGAKAHMAIDYFLSVKESINKL